MGWPMSGSKPLRSIETLDRASVAASTCAVLNRGGWGNPDVLLVETSEGNVVVKDFAPRSEWVRRLFGVWLINREERAYRRLAGVTAIPNLLRRLDRDAIVIEYRPGILLSRSLAGKLSEDFLPELERAVLEMHGRGVVHLDLRHRSNILAGDDGHPVLLDFASAFRFDLRRTRGRWGIALLAWIDRRALNKWRIRLGQRSAAASPGSTSAVA